MRRRRRGSLRLLGRRVTGFSLIELLVVVAILGVLMAIMTTSLTQVRAAGKSFVCKNQLRNIAFDFIQFADDYAHPWRGDSEKAGKSSFYLQDFQERQYGISEFWKVSATGQSSQGGAVKLRASEQPMICPAGPQDLERTPNEALKDRKAVTPLTNVSTGFNMRLYYGSFLPPGGGTSVLSPVRLSKRITSQITVPLVFDVDGTIAMARHPAMEPYYSAPATGGTDRFATGFYWYPSLRHGNRFNAAFIGGHVLSSSHPESELGWNWKYQPPAE